MVNVEITRFNLKPSVSRESLLAASQTLNQEFLSAQPGWLRRELLHVNGNVYIDLIHWVNADDAANAVRQFDGSPAAQAYFALMDQQQFDPTSDMTHGKVLARFE